MAAIHVTKTDFDQKIGSGVAFVDFWAEWCGPCKMAGPIIDGLADEYAGKAVVAKLNVDEEGEIAQKHNVQSIPTVVLFKDGKEIGRQVGFAGKNGYTQLLQKAGI